ncbi:MAG: protein kinase [Candidatus Riflebacteria bacterium]|nr:protein kinase [Candidatus Riflebacteria bacterium]
MERPTGSDLQPDLLTRFGDDFLARYEPIAELGRGAMGVVYKMKQLATRRMVAIKLLRSSELPQEATERVLVEARILARLNHPNIVTIFDCGTDRSVPYLVCEYVDGGSLADRLKKKRPMPLRKAIRLGLQILRGLRAAHDKGIVHRDLKPENILISTEGSAKIADFGLAKAARQAVDESLGMSERTGKLFGTPPYMSPEQCRGKPTGPATDLYAFGVILFQMLTGRLPFQGPDLYSFLDQHVRQPAPSPRLTVPELDLHLDRIVLAALAKTPDERLGGSAAAFRAELLRVQRSHRGAGKEPVARALTHPAPAGSGRTFREPSEVSMFRVAAGAATIGCDMGEEDQRPAHQVFIDEFWIDEWPVTNYQFLRFVEATGYTTEAQTRGYGWTRVDNDFVRRVKGLYWRRPEEGSSPLEQRLHLPVTQLHWEDAEAYCRWVGKRLPTEAEWEKAARLKAGLAPADLERAQSHRASGAGAQGPHRGQGIGRARIWQTYNVEAFVIWEWCSDWYLSEFYRESPATNPQGISGQVLGFGKVIRSSAAWTEYGAPHWACIREDCSVSCPGVGFRCVSTTLPTGAVDVTDKVLKRPRG